MRWCVWLVVALFAGVGCVADYTIVGECRRGEVCAVSSATESSTEGSTSDGSTTSSGTTGEGESSGTTESGSTTDDGDGNDDDSSTSAAHE